MAEEYKHSERRTFVHIGYRFKGFHPINGCSLVKPRSGAPSYTFYIELTDKSAAWEEVLKKAAQKKCRSCGAAFNSDLIESGRFGDWV